MDQLLVTVTGKSNLTLLNSIDIKFSNFRVLLRHSVTLSFRAEPLLTLQEPDRATDDGVTV